MGHYFHDQSGICPSEYIADEADREEMRYNAKRDLQYLIEDVENLLSGMHDIERETADAVILEKEMPLCNDWDDAYARILKAVEILKDIKSNI